MPVADHFMAFDSRVKSQIYANGRSGGTPAGNETAARTYGDVCETCYAYFPGGKAELWRHVRNEHGADRRLKCPAPGCGRRFLARFMSAAHSAHHHHSSGDGGPPPFTCELCGHLPLNRSAFDRHMAKAHPETRDALCGVCRLYKGDVPSLVDHVRRRHGDEMAVVGQDAAAVACNAGDATRRRCVRCDVCGKRYGNNRNMYAHRLVHGACDEQPQMPFSNLPSP